MDRQQFDVTPFLNQDEGQHFDRKSLFEGPEGAKRPRDRRTVRDQVAEYVAAFANAEGGVLVLGIEDDHTITGHSLPPQALESLLKTPRTRLDPPQPEGFLVTVQEKQLIVFDVPAADSPVQVVGGGFPFRTGDSTLQVKETFIRNHKLSGLIESWESRPASCTVDDLDRGLLARARHGAGLSALTDDEYLLKRKLADHRGGHIALRRAAELLFAKFGPDHPNAGVRVFRVIGTERRSGPEHNVEERPRIEGNLSTVLTEADQVVGNLLRRPSRLVGTRFRQVSEYPEFSWKEALLNAIAHRDYSVQGAGIEIWLFEDRMEVVSPGGLVDGLSVEDLLSLKRFHRSRNPRLVRVLVDLGVARDQGEGIPRMFAEMEDAFLPRPEFAVTPLQVGVTLRNTPTLTATDREFIAKLGNADLSHEEFRALLHAHRHGRVENADMRLQAGLDTLSASQVLRRLRDRDLLELHAHGANSFYTLPLPLRSTDQLQFAPDWGERSPHRGESLLDRGEPLPDRGELSEELRTAIQALGKRPRKEPLREVIAQLCRSNWATAADLSGWLNFRQDKLTERHLSAMVEEGQLERRFPDNPTHPEQAYRTTARQVLLPFMKSAE